MAKEFREGRAGAGRGSKLIGSRRSNIPLLLGGVVVLSLVASNISLLVTGGTLGDQVPGDINAPPTNLLLQRVLFHPKDEEEYLRRVQGNPCVSSFSTGFAPEERPGTDVPLNRPRLPDISRTLLRGDTLEVAFPPELPCAEEECCLLEAHEDLRLTDRESLRFVPSEEAVMAPGSDSLFAAVGSSQGLVWRVTFPAFSLSRSHVLGTDDNGRDLWELLVAGSRWAVVPGFITVAVGVLGGLLLGGLSGFYGGWMDRVGLAFTGTLESVPGLILLFLVAVISGFNLLWVMVVVGVMILPDTFKAVRTKVLLFKERQFIEAARELGMSDRAILWREILWYNARGQLLSITAQAFSLAILMEVTLSYLGLGVQTGVSWGRLLQEGRMSLTGFEQGQARLWMLIFPGLAIVISVLGFQLLGRGIEQALSRTEEE